MRRPEMQPLISHQDWGSREHKKPQQEPKTRRVKHTKEHDKTSGPNRLLEAVLLQHGLGLVGRHGDASPGLRLLVLDETARAQPQTLAHLVAFFLELEDLEDGLREARRGTAIAR